MDQNRSTSPTQWITLPLGDRWQVYHRLQELGITCICPDDGSCQVNIESPTTLLQVWWVIRQVTAPRQELITWLEHCWYCQ